MLRKIGFIQITHKPSEVIIIQKFFRFSVVFDLSYLLHRIFDDDIIVIKPREKSLQIADIIVYRGIADWCAEISAPFRCVSCFCLFDGIKSIFAPLLK